MDHKAMDCKDGLNQNYSGNKRFYFVRHSMVSRNIESRKRFYILKNSNHYEILVFSIQSFRPNDLHNIYSGIYA